MMLYRIPILFLFAGINIFAWCQTPAIELTFTAESNGYHLPLDHILIENLSQGGDTSLYPPDTVLVLDITTATGELNITSERSLSVSQNYPNPFHDHTRFELFIPGKSWIKITVRDMLSRIVTDYENTLSAGLHTFIFYPGDEEYYLLTVTDMEKAETIIMLNATPGSASGVIPELIYSEQKYVVMPNKSQENRSGFLFDLGDELRYTAYSALGIQFITDIPMDDETYVFQFPGNSCPGVPHVTDLDGNVYSTVLIGSQCWMVENLKTTLYQDGSPIPNVTGNEWSTLSTGAYVWYDNNASNKETYGALYNWFAVMDPHGLCPTGWHVPTNDDWDVLTNFIGGTSSPFGNSLKSCRQVNSPLGGECATDDHPRWAEHITHYGTDDHGFSALPGGTRHFLGSFVTLGYIGSYWSSTESTSDYGWLRGLEYNNGYVDVYAFYKKNGYSVRCVKD